jgi:hypothetical protein
MKNIIDRLKLSIADSKIGNFLNPVYELKYKPENKDTSTYLTSRPFDRFEEGITAYCFGKGVRRFRYDRIVERRVLTLV